jgi:hypothetical protein
MSVGGLHVLRLHHPIPATDKIGAFIIETDPLKSSAPCGSRGGLPFFHFQTTMGTPGNFMLVHGLLLKKSSRDFTQKRINPLKPLPGDLVRDFRTNSESHIITSRSGGFI